jgi:tRNA (guanosine-2'-O-)-methyltransferase
MRVKTHEDLSAACGFLRERGFQLVAAHLSPGAVDYRDLDYTKPTALVVGTELFGVSDQALELADHQVRIPMKGMTQSLNVSVACAIVLYEAMRQRELAGMYGQLRLDRDTLESQRFEWLHPAVTQFCRERGLEYPELDDNGDVIGDLPRGTA